MKSWLALLNCLNHPHWSQIFP